MFSWLARARGRTLGILLVAAVFLLGVAAAPASAQAEKRVVKVMAYNMDAGTDFLYFLKANLTLDEAFTKTYAELLASNFSGRADRLADAIAVEMPYLASLEEVTLWEWVDGNGVSQQVVADQLELLKTALKTRKLPYKVMLVQRLTNLYLPMPDGSMFHSLDRNVLLVRTDLSQAELDVSNLRQAKYKNFSEPLDGFIVVNGWFSADVKIRGKNVRFFGTHLASAADPEDPLQPAQGDELIEEMGRSPYPVILAGDFNSDMSGLGLFASDVTPTAPNIVAAGYEDVWTAAGYQPFEGLTWPLYWEDILADMNLPPGPVERIDLIFQKGLEVVGAATVGTTPVYPSDHAGVVATLLIGK